MNTEAIVGLCIAAVLMFNTWQTKALQLEVENLKTLRVYEKALYDANLTREQYIATKLEEIRKEYNEKINGLNNTPIGTVIDFGD